jgi:hypothetical protein
MADKKIEDETENEFTSKDWFGPSGECWCEKEKKMVNPMTCYETYKCPECKLLPGTNTRQFRYFHLHDDYKSSSEKIIFDVLAKRG